MSRVADRDLVSARFPRLAEGYESYFLRATEPSGGRGFWIRYTVHRGPGRPPRGSLWFTYFDAAAPAPVAAKATLDDPRAEAGSWIRIGDAAADEGGARGAIETRDAGVSWELSLSGAQLFPHLSRPWMYDAPLPRTKPVSVHPSARFSGTLVIDERVVAVDGWPGMVGHNWGSEHAERWIWLHGTGLGGDEGAWLDVVLARLKIGPATTPWSGFGGLCLDGEVHRLGGLSRTRSTRVSERPDRLDLWMTGPSVQVHGRVSAPPHQVVGWVYADPDGSEHHVAHCSIADLELDVEGQVHPMRTLRAAGVAAYELGMRERDHGLTIQPFPDG